MYHVLHSIACYNPATGCYMIINNFLKIRKVWDTDGCQPH